MKRFAALMAIVLAVCAGAYFGAYFFGTASARKMAAENEKYPELGWLKKEFNLDDKEFVRIGQLHDAYQPRCAEMCERVDAKNKEIKEALAKAEKMTPEIERKLAEAAQLRA